MDANVQKAINTTLKMLTSEDISTPNAWNGDLATMQGILVGVVQGTWELKPTAPVRQGDTPSDDSGDGDEGKGTKH